MTAKLIDQLVAKYKSCPLCGSQDPNDHVSDCFLLHYDWEARKWKDVERRVDQGGAE
jgi:hypothetical protein